MTFAGISPNQVTTMNISTHSIDKKKLARVISYRHPALVHRLQEKEGLTLGEAETLFEDTKRFLFLCGSFDEVMAPSPMIDQGWHHFILFTRDYATFCHDYIGSFIHHCPHQPGATPDHYALNSATLTNAKLVFGDDLSPNWNLPAGSSCNDECSATTNCQDSTSDCSN